MNKVSNNAAISSIDFNELDTKYVTKSLKMRFYNIESEVVSTQSVQFFVPKLLLGVELQVFTCKLSNVPLLTQLHDSMVDLIKLKPDLAF